MSKPISIAIAYLCLGLFIGSLVFVRFGPVFKLRSISCQVSGGSACPPEVWAELNRYRQTLIFYLPVATLRHRLLVGLPTVNQATVTVTWPDHLAVVLQPDTPWFQLTLPADPQVYFVSRGLRVLAINPVPDPALITVGINQPLKIYLGQSVDDPTIKYTVDILRLAALNGINLLSITIESPSLIILNLTSGYQAVMTSTDDATRQLTALQLVLTKATMSPSLPVIDVRFSKPILKPDLQQ